MAGNIVERIDDLVAVRTALVSVSDKTGLDDLVTGLLDVCPDLLILSTGGTYAKIADVLGTRASGHLQRVSAYTGQPETQGGLVKTLDFKIYLGLLTETYNDAHQLDMSRTGARPIDLVVCNLYPFEATVSQPSVTVEQARANIDIGGPTMVRAAAKNYLRVSVLTDPGDYASFIDGLRSSGGSTDLRRRFDLARKAFAHTAAYDRAISEYLAGVDADGIHGIYRVAD